jgi:hypothetical protein
MERDRKGGRGVTLSPSSFMEILMVVGYTGWLERAIEALVKREGREGREGGEGGGATRTVTLSWCCYVHVKESSISY